MKIRIGQENTILFIVISEIIIRSISSDIPNIVANIIFLTTLFVLLIKLAISTNKKMIISPICLFTCMALIFSIGGEISWIVRNYFLFFVQGKLFDVADFYRYFCLIFYIASTTFLRKTMNKEIGLQNDIYYLHPNTKIAISLFFTYAGAFIITNGFTAIAILSDSPDEIRYASRENSNLTFASIALLIGIYGILISYKKYYSSLRKLPILFFILFFLFLIPFTFNAGRLQVALPFMIIFCFSILEGKTSLSGRNILRLIALALASFLIIALIGAYRAFGSDSSTESTILFLLNDVFPEFWGTVHTSALTDNRFILIEPISFVLAGSFPRSILKAFGINKFDYFWSPGAIIGEMWNSQYSIRLSLIGELYYSSFASKIAVILILLVTLYYLSCKLIDNRCKSKYLIVMIGLMIALTIPYGFSLFVTIILFFIASYILFVLPEKIKNI